MEHFSSSPLPDYNLPPRPSPCFNPSQHDNDLQFEMHRLRSNHVFQAAIRHLQEKDMQAFLKKRGSKIAQDLNFLEDLFKLAIEIDREHYATLLKNRE